MNGSRRSLALAVLATLLLAAGVKPACAQMSERPGTSLDGWSAQEAKDVTGYSIKNHRVRVIHSTDAAVPGTSGWIIRRDPWLAFQLGRNMYQREWRERDGASGNRGEFFGAPLPDGRTQPVPLADMTSCGTCHGNIYREPGPGLTIPRSSGKGRNTPGNFGLGLIEMIALQNRLRLLQIADPSRDGWVSRDEMQGQALTVSPAPGMPVVNFGANADADGDGRPDLNKVLRVWFVDSDGRRLPSATSLNDPGVAGYSFTLQPFGWGEHDGGVTSTIRSFVRDAMKAHFSLELHDRTFLDDEDVNGVAGTSILGAQQFTLEEPPDKGASLTLLGLSNDDPDGDGTIEELTEGDADLLEFYLLHAPVPAQMKEIPAVEHGRQLMGTFGCTSCHVPDWSIEAANPGDADVHKRYAGDRRLLEVKGEWNGVRDRLELKVTKLTAERDGLAMPAGGAFLAEGVFSDFTHHDMGEGFAELNFDGSVQRGFRTPALWGARDSAPYGHDGASLTLDDVIRRHGGEGQTSRDQYAAAAESDRDDLLAFLGSLVLYQTEELPFDLDGDGTIADSGFAIGGTPVGRERFNPEWLFQTKVRPEGPITNAGGGSVISLAALNRTEAYGEDLAALSDLDQDGFADLVDPCPEVAGFMDGCRSEVAAYRTLVAQDFVGATGGWTAFSAPPTHETPLFKDGFGALQINLDRLGTYGGFSSPVQHIALPEAGVLRIAWTISGSPGPSGKLPVFRMIGHRADFSRSDVLVVNAGNETSPAAPRAWGKTYYQYILARPGENDWVFTFDAHAFEAGQEGSAVRLHNIKVENLGSIADFAKLPHPVEFDFASAANGWTAGTAGSFAQPLSSVTEEGLRLQLPGSAANVYGYYESPAMDITPRPEFPLRAGGLVRVPEIPLVVARPAVTRSAGHGLAPVVRLRLWTPDFSMVSLINYKTAPGDTLLPDLMLAPVAGMKVSEVKAAVDIMGQQPDVMDPGGAVVLRSMTLETYRAVTTR
ncbi:hypothetical protein HZA57_00520 [Candidatus Poribacteria bacterium]|nr:hypothetical protein [Candidatus Poribacteria bacterium]